MIKKQGKNEVTRERVLTVRVTFDQLDALKRTAKYMGITVSKVVRDSITRDAEVAVP